MSRVIFGLDDLFLPAWPLVAAGRGAKVSIPATPGRGGAQRVKRKRPASRLEESPCSHNSRDNNYRGWRASRGSHARACCKPCANAWHDCCTLAQARQRHRRSFQRPSWRRLSWRQPPPPSGRGRVACSRGPKIFAPQNGLRWRGVKWGSRSRARRPLGRLRRRCGASAGQKRFLPA